MLPAQGSRELDQRRFTFVVIAVHSRNEIGDAAQMMTNRMVRDLARGCHACKLDDLRKDSIDGCVSIECAAPPFAGEVSPLRQGPSGIADLVERAVVRVSGSNPI